MYKVHANIVYSTRGIWQNVDKIRLLFKYEVYMFYVSLCE